MFMKDETLTIFFWEQQQQQQQNVYWVTAGVIVGHSMCTGLAVIGGRMLAAKISVRTGKKRVIVKPEAF